MTDVRDKVGITTLGGNIAPLIGRAFAHGRDNCSAPQPADVTRILAHWRFFWMGACLAVRSGQMGGVFSFRWVRRYIKSHCWGGLWEGNSCCVWVPSRLCYIPCSCAGPVKWFRFFVYFSCFLFSFQQIKYNPTYLGFVNELLSTVLPTPFVRFFNIPRLKIIPADPRVWGSASWYVTCLLCTFYL